MIKKENKKFRKMFIVTEYAALRVCTKKNSYFSTKTYVVGTLKNSLIETVLLSTQNIC